MKDQKGFLGAISNYKGGTGKTITSVSLSSALAIKQKKVLLVDNDPQSDSTRALIQDPKILLLDDSVSAVDAQTEFLMRKALDESSISGSEKLNSFIRGPVAFLFTNDSPYSIANYLEKNKVKAPAKGGQIAPISVTVPKMNTGFPPGTIISELNSVGLGTRIEGGTVAIPNDTVVVEVGEKISGTLASILARLEIEPFLVGLSLDTVLENGEIIPHDELLIDFDEVKEQLMYAHKLATSVAVHASIVNEETANLVIGSAHQKALALAVATGYVTKETAPRVFAQANANALALIRAILEVDNSAVPAELKALVN